MVAEPVRHMLAGTVIHVIMNFISSNERQQPAVQAILFIAKIDAPQFIGKIRHGFRVYPVVILPETQVKYIKKYTAFAKGVSDNLKVFFATEMNMNETVVSLIQRLTE